MKTASGPLSGPGTYLHWGVIQLSLANLVVIGLGVLLLLLAILLPFPSGPRPASTEADPDVHP